MKAKEKTPEMKTLSQHMNMKKTQKIESKTEVNRFQYLEREINENG
jgi:hypothetical protein